MDSAECMGRSPVLPDPGQVYTSEFSVAGIECPGKKQVREENVCFGL